MSARWKARLLVVGALLLSGLGAALAIFLVVIPRERRKAVDGLVKSAGAKAEALQEAAVVLHRHAEEQATKVDQKVEKEKQSDPVDLANDFINGRKS